ncbi:hypothetical protein NYV35_25690 [Escherichia coli]|nr:hypothetical protein [Escherichia coli]
MKRTGRRAVPYRRFVYFHDFIPADAGKASNFCLHLFENGVTVNGAKRRYRFENIGTG